MTNEKNNRGATIGTSDEPENALEPGVTLAGRYELIKQIGRGGMGVVWSAEDKTAERKVVLKFVPREIEKFEEAVAQLKSSFNKIHDLHHPHVCPVYTLENDWEHGYYHVMKWLDGETLDQYVVRTVGRQQPLPLDEVLRILQPVAEALDYAHSKRIIHRDIKPLNIFLVLDGEKSIQDVQVIDFGIASEIRSSLMDVSQMRFDTLGTRRYMAPEQWRVRPQSGRTDQYALAVVAYELLAGYLPFDSDDIAMLRQAVMQDPLEAIRGVPEHVNTTIQKALEREATKRFENCREFVRSLEAAPVDTLTGRMVLELEQEKNYRYRGQAIFSPDGKKIAFSRYNCVCIFDAKSGEKLHVLHTTQVASVSFSPNGRTIVVQVQNALQILSTESWKVLHTRDGIPAYTVVFSPDGKKIVLQRPQKLLILDAESEEIHHEFGVHQQGFLDGVFSPDGKKIAVSVFEPAGRGYSTYICTLE